MKLRTRVAVLTALATAVTVVLVSVFAWALANRQMLNTVDDQLDERAADLDVDGRRSRGGQFLAGDVAIQLILQDRQVTTGELAILVSEDDFAVADGEARTSRRTTTGVSSNGDEVSVRVLTIAVENRFPQKPIRAVMLARPLTEVNESLQRLRAALVVLSLIGVAGAGLAGLLIADRTLRPVGRLTTTVEGIARTTNIDTEIEVERPDELGRLAQSFNAMLAALRRSKEQQERLVYDASHELRTPLTSLRTNIELLQRAPDITPEQLAPVLDDIVAELDELTALVTELVDLATDQHQAGNNEEIDLDLLVTTVVERHRRRTDHQIELVVEPSTVVGVPSLIDRAVSNLVENAIKFSPSGSTVSVTVARGRVVVADEGPGIAVEDRNSVFERFWRAYTARTMPGSGLGLSIVAQVAQSHGGRVTIIDGATTGATIELVLPET